MMATPPVPDWFDADRAAFMQSGVSMSLGARDAGLRPSLTRGIGCRVLAGGELRIFVDGTVSQALLRDIGANGQLAAVFSDIVSHRTLQVKAVDARVQPLDADDHLAVEAYEQRFGGAIVDQGYAESIPRAILATAHAARVAIACHPREGFEQTPGPQAGQPLEPRR